MDIDFMEQIAAARRIAPHEGSRIKVILISSELADACSGWISDDLTPRLQGLPVKISDLLPVDSKDGPCHAIALYEEKPESMYLSGTWGVSLSLPSWIEKRR